MLTILFETHSTTFDNEAKIASGHYDVALSPAGEKQAAELGRRYAARRIATVYCSDLQRSWRTAAIAFATTGLPVVQDRRLRECDYGDWTRKPMPQIEIERGKRVTTPFPNGESFADCAARVRGFLDDVMGHSNDATVMIIGHRATQYGLEHWISGVPLEKAVVAPWRWQPGWTYILTRLRDPI